MADKEVRYDIDGQEVVSTALMDLINEYPGLTQGEYIQYATLGDSKGKAVFPTSGSAIKNEIKDVTGHVKQTCDYPFIVIYRASGLSESKKEKVKEWLDNLGRWLEKQPIIVNGKEYKLDEYPALTRGRKFKRIQRVSPSYLDSINEDKAENWAINITATYTNEYDL